MSAHGGTTPPPVEQQGINVYGDGIQELQTKLALLQQIQELQAAIGYTPPATSHPRSAIPQNIKVPEGRYTMSLSEFLTYSKGCLDYKNLSGYTDNQIVLQMRIHMDSDLKQSIDTNYILWGNTTVEEAIQIVGEIVDQISNCAVHRKAFHNMTQAGNETIREFATRLRSCVADCLFLCPYDDNHDLTDYHLIDLIHSRVSDTHLQQELLQNQASLNNLQLIIQYREDFESVKRDQETLQNPTKNVIRNISHPDLENASDEELVAALSAYRRNKTKGLQNRGNKSVDHSLLMQ